jgi:hypothetical protein
MLLSTVKLRPRKRFTSVVSLDVIDYRIVSFRNTVTYLSGLISARKSKVTIRSEGQRCNILRLRSDRRKRDDL